jgi:hypothetical protein
VSVTRADVEAAESPKDLYDLALALCDERDRASDRFADGMVQACTLIRRGAEEARASYGADVLRFLDDLSREDVFEQFKEAAEALRRG